LPIKEKQKAIKDPNLVIKNCKVLENIITQMTETLPRTKDDILPALNQDEFKVICSSKERLGLALNLCLKKMLFYLLWI
jgi:hypothetical protein